MLNLILGFILISIVLWEISLNFPFPLHKGWDAETTSYFFKWLTIGIIALILIISAA